ncbi:Amino acid permease [Minicystis rosea]|nr:Amino acid permease [Minicystis rosea]
MPASSEAPRLDAASALRRRLGLFDVLCIGVNATVGSGVFALPDDMQRAMGGWSPLAYLFCAILLLPVALSFAELSGHFDESGGAYVYARSAFGDRVGFLVGWFCWAATFVSWAANTTLLVDLLGFHAYPWNKLLAAAVILALGAINYVGVKPGAWVVNLVVIGKLGAILCFILAAFFALDPSRLGGPLPQGFAGVGTGVYLALFPLQGFEVAPVVAGETANPRRNVPLGTMGSLLLSALLFIIVQAALVATYPHLARSSQTPLADAAQHIGPRVGLIVLIGSFVSIGGFTAGSALGSPRYAEAIASHGLLPRALARVHRRWSTPYVAIVVTTLLSAVLAFFFDYRRLVGMANVTVVIQYFSTCVAVPLIRRRVPENSKAWRIPGGIIVPLLGAVGSLGLFAAADREEWIFAAATLVVGVIVAKASARKEIA